MTTCSENAAASRPADGVRGMCSLVEGPVAGVELPRARRGDAPLPEGEIAITRLPDEATADLYLQALEAADRVDTPLTRVLLGARPERPAPPPAPLPGLDPTQRVAAGHCLSDAPLALVHGPPGTGKTRLLAAVLRAMVDRGDRPLALADSNAAVDHLALSAAATVCGLVACSIM